MAQENDSNDSFDLLINIPGLTKFGIEDDPGVTAGQLEYAAQESVKVVDKLKSLIKNGNLTLEDKVVKLLAVELTGDFTITHVGLRYLYDSEEYYVKYLKKNFYNIK